MNIFEALLMCPESAGIDEAIRNSLEGLNAPSNWGIASREAVAVAILRSDYVGCQLLTAEQYSQFRNLVEAALSKVSTLEALSVEQTQMAYAIRNTRNYTS